MRPIRININSPAGNLVVPSAIIQRLGGTIDLPKGAYRPGNEKDYQSAIKTLERTGYVKFYRSKKYVVYPFSNEDIVEMLLSGIKSESLDKQYAHRTRFLYGKEYEDYIKGELISWGVFGIRKNPRNIYGDLMGWSCGFFVSRPLTANPVITELQAKGLMNAHRRGISLDGKYSAGTLVIGGEGFKEVPDDT